MTYAELYGGNERLPVDRMLRREGHPLGVRRAEATKAATEEPEASQAHKRWTLGVAAGALLMAGTFAAGALGLHGGATPVAGSAPEHAPASPGHTPDGGPAVGAPVPGQDKQQDQPGQPETQQPQETTPASTGTNGGIPVVPNTGTGANGGDGQRTAPGGDTSTTTPPTQTTPPTTSEPAPQPAPEQPSDDGGLLGTVGDVLTPVTDVVGGILSPSSSSTAATTTKAAPAGPALTMIDPLGDLVGS